MSGNRRSSVPPLTLAEMVDLQTLLERDVDEDEQALLDRDGGIGRSLGAANLNDSAAMRAWVGQRQLQEGSSIGSRLQSWGASLSWLLRVAAGLAGLVTVGGWLKVQGRQPLNVINFWTALVGSQVLVLMFLAYSVARWRWLSRRPHAGGAGGTLGLPLVASLIDKLWMRTAKPGHDRGITHALWTKLRKMYGEVMGWQALQWTQSFAVFFNLGAILGLALWSTISDPSFGWRSTLLDEQDVSRWAQSLALPWSWSTFGEAPSHQEVIATRYSSLDLRFAGSAHAAHQAPVWAAWWPFLLMSLLAYGLVPRVIAYVWTSFKSRRAVAAEPWRSAAAEQVLHRMRRTAVSAHEAHASIQRFNAQALPPEPTAAASDARPVAVLKWSSIPFSNDGELAAAVHSTIGSPIRGPIATVGGRDLHADEAAIARLAAAEGSPGVAVLVQGWDPPVGDHVDFLQDLRAALKNKRSVHVIVCGLGGSMTPAPPTEAQIRLWRNRLLAIGDPWLRVHPLRGDAA